MSDYELTVEVEEIVEVFPEPVEPAEITEPELAPIAEPEIPAEEKPVEYTDDSFDPTYGIAEDAKGVWLTEGLWFDFNGYTRDQVLETTGNPADLLESFADQGVLMYCDGGLVFLEGHTPDWIL